MAEDGSFDYSSEMKEYYTSQEVAQEYYEAYSDMGNWRHRLIAGRERNTIKSFLSDIPCESVIDIPTGTGKLAPVFAETGSTVLACDISEEMLDVAMIEFSEHDVEDVRFEVCDAEDASTTIDETFDVAVCLRLLHRVPTETKREILSELGAMADIVIASTGIDSRYHRIRRRVRQRLYGGTSGRGHCFETASNTYDIFSDGFEIVEMKRILPLLSQERVYLLRPK